MAHGYFNFGGAGTYQKAMIERARTVVIVETSEGLPYVYGPAEWLSTRAKSTS